MTGENPPPADVLALRVVKTQELINHHTVTYDGGTSDAQWLTRMASLRADLAAVYQQASANYRADTVEWHALTEAALWHEMNAAENLAAAKRMNVNTTEDGAA